MNNNRIERKADSFKAMGTDSSVSVREKNSHTYAT